MYKRKLLLTALMALVLGACGRDATETGTGAMQPAAQKAEAQKAEAPASQAAAMPRSKSPPGARLYFITPADGATVSSPVTVEFGLEGMDVVPAGSDEPMSGHHHVIIDADLPPFDAPIPADKNHVHFGDGSTSTELELGPGTHTLQLLLGDYRHVPHDPPVYSERITITVE